MVQKSGEHHLGCKRTLYLKVKIDGLQIPKGRLVEGPYQPICRHLCHVLFNYCTPPPKLTELAGKWTWIEDVFPIEHGDFPAIAMFTRGSFG